MAAAAMATAAGAAVVFYYTKWGIPWAVKAGETAEASPSAEETDGQEEIREAIRRRIEPPKPARAPFTWYEAISTITETLRFTYSETLGKWPIGDLAFGINYLLRKQGHLRVADVYLENSDQLRGPRVLGELRALLRLLSLCILFSKNPFPKFLEASGYSTEDVLLQEGKAGLLRPAFTVLLDKESACILLLIRGTHSIKDTLTALTGAVVPFHHTVLDEGGVQNLVLGYAHCGMVAAARWIAQHATPRLLDALKEYPTYSIKVVGHSLGGGTAALLTYILREQDSFGSAHCICFAPAACMTWELAVSGLPFVTSFINGTDLVPTFSAASVDDLRAEVTASRSAWVNDIREQIERTKVLKTVIRSASALGSRLSSIASMSRASLQLYPNSAAVAKAARSGVASAGAILRPVSAGGLVGWSCMGARRRSVTAAASSTKEHASTSVENIECQVEDRAVVVEDADSALVETRLTLRATSSSTEEHNGSDSKKRLGGWISEEIPERGLKQIGDDEEDCPSSCPHSAVFEGETYGQEDFRDDEDGPMTDNKHNGGDEPTEDYIWQQIEHELERQRDKGTSFAGPEVEEAAREITKEEEDILTNAAMSGNSNIVTDSEDGIPLATNKSHNRFFPPGRIVHMVCHPPATEDGPATSTTDDIGLYLTDRALYGKIRLSRTMIHDHYMPNYRRMMEALIQALEQDIMDVGHTEEVEADETDLLLGTKVL